MDLTSETLSKRHLAHMTFPIKASNESLQHGRALYGKDDSKAKTAGLVKNQTTSIS